MFIKPQSTIPAGTKITKCPPSEGKKLKSVYSLQREAEKKAEFDNNKKELAERFMKYLKSGKTVQEALALCSE